MSSNLASCFFILLLKKLCCVVVYLILVVVLVTLSKGSRDCYVIFIITFVMIRLNLKTCLSNFNKWVLPHLDVQHMFQPFQMPSLKLLLLQPFFHHFCPAVHQKLLQNQLKFAANYCKIPHQFLIVSFNLFHYVHVGCSAVSIISFI